MQIFIKKFQRMLFQIDFPVVFELSYFSLQLSRECSHEVRRVMKMRTASVHMNPLIEEPCMQDIATYCITQIETGEVRAKARAQGQWGNVRIIKLALSKVK